MAACAFVRDLFPPASMDGAFRNNAEDRGSLKVKNRTNYYVNGTFLALIYKSVDAYQKKVFRLMYIPVNLLPERHPFGWKE